MQNSKAIIHQTDLQALQRCDLVAALQQARGGSQQAWNGLGLLLIKAAVRRLCGNVADFTDMAFYLAQATDRLTWCANAGQLGKHPAEFIAELYQFAVTAMGQTGGHQHIPELDQEVISFLVMLEQG